jgi:hypothetical protein
MATPDMVWIGFGEAAEVLIVASEALPSRRVGEHLVEIDTSPWQDWPWQPATVLPGESVRDVTILRYGPEADLSLAWDIGGGQGRKQPR